MALKRQLDQANESLTEILSYLVTVVVPFDGTVAVTSTSPPVSANYTTIRDWAARILQEVEANNRTAFQNYETIMSLYEQVSLMILIVVMVMVMVVMVMVMIVMMMMIVMVVIVMMMVMEMIMEMMIL